MKSLKDMMFATMTKNSPKLPESAVCKTADSEPRILRKPLIGQLVMQDPVKYFEQCIVKDFANNLVNAYFGGDKRLPVSMRKPKMVFAVAYSTAEGVEWFYRIDKFDTAKQYAEMLNGKVYLQRALDNIITDPIWPKEPKPLPGWRDINDAFVIASGIKKLPKPPMFEYLIECGDYAGELTWDIEYSGTDSEKARKAYKDAKDWLGMVRVKIKVLGRKEKRSDDDGDEDFDWDEWDDDLLEDFEFDDEEWQ